MIIPDYRNFQSSNELYHYGMPRRSGRYPYGSGDRPYQGLKNRRKILKYQDSRGNLTSKGIKAISNINLDASPQRFKDKTFKKGTIFNRVGSEEETDDGRTYVSITDNDKLRYINIKETLTGNNILSLKAKEKIKVGGLDAQTESFIELLKTTPIENFISKPYIVNGKETTNSKKRRSKELQDYIDIFEKGDLENAKKQFFARIMYDDEISQKFFDKMLSKGYNTIIDMNDVRFAEFPLIVLDRSKSLKTISNKKITQEEMDNANITLNNLGLISKWLGDDI